MNFRFLEAPLWPTAEAAKAFFKKELGVTSFKIEQPIQPDMEYGPTLSAVTKDFHWLCIEVSESAWPQRNVLDAFVLDCKNRCLPVRLYVAIPRGTSDPAFRANLKRAKQNGVGVVEVDEVGGNVFQDALSLSLTGLRGTNPIDFPPKYRSAIRDAGQTFCNGSPGKGCSTIYEEIEALSRRLAKKTKQRGFWRALKPSEKPPKIDLVRGQWARLMKILIEHLDLKKCRCSKLNEPLLARVLGITGHRNESAHKPHNQTMLKKRDEELRTRFEAGIDILRDLINATKPLRL